MANANERPLGRCCDCAYLGVFPDGRVVCEGPIPDVWAAEIASFDISADLEPSGLVYLRRCDCFKKREVANA